MFCIKPIPEILSKIFLHKIPILENKGSANILMQFSLVGFPRVELILNVGEFVYLEKFLIQVAKIIFPKSYKTRQKDSNKNKKPPQN